MKKILIFLAVTTMGFSQVPKDISINIEKWVEETYPVESFGQEENSKYLQEEIQAYQWIKKNIRKDRYNQLARTYQPNKIGYSLVKKIYIVEETNKKKG